MAGARPIDPQISTSPIYNCAAANLHDTNKLTNGPCRAIAFGGNGDIKLVTLKGDTVIIPSGVLQFGMVYAIGAQQIFSTGTTATDIWVFY